MLLAVGVCSWTSVATTAAQTIAACRSSSKTSSSSRRLIVVRRRDGSHEQLHKRAVVVAASADGASEGGSRKQQQQPPHQLQQQQQPQPSNVAADRALVPLLRLTGGVDDRDHRLEPMSSSASFDEHVVSVHARVKGILEALKSGAAGVADQLNSLLWLFLLTSGNHDVSFLLCCFIRRARVRRRALACS